MKKATPYIIIALVLLVVGMLIPVSSPVISIKAEHLFSLGPLNVTNSLLTAWIVTGLIFLMVFFGTRKMFIYIFKSNPIGIRDKEGQIGG